MGVGRVKVRSSDRRSYPVNGRKPPRSELKVASIAVHDSIDPPFFSLISIRSSRENLIARAVEEFFFPDTF